MHKIYFVKKKSHVLGDGMLLYIESYVYKKRKKKRKMLIPIFTVKKVVHFSKMSYGKYGFKKS